MTEFIIYTVNQLTQKLFNHEKIKLSLNKKNISNLETNEIIGGVSGRTCEYTNKYYKTCYGSTCDIDISRAIGCSNTILVCEM